jgi:hypothetical protein
MGRDEVGTLSTLTAYRVIIDDYSSVNFLSIGDGVAGPGVNSPSPTAIRE